MKYIISDIFQGNYPITQRYGENPQYYQRFGLKYHEGVDWGTPVGVNVLAPFENNKVLRNGWDPIYGNYLVIWDPKQLCAIWYCHLSIIACKPGDTPVRGTVLGKTGNSGNSTGAHLHVNFCLTDAFANRLNTGNGTLGFLNILDPNLVEWKLAGSAPPPMTAEEQVKAIKSKINTAITDTDFRNWTRTLLGV